ncbi:MAG: hypothetical protein RLN90_09410 [Balneolaceae bacterium]
MKTLLLILFLGLSTGSLFAQIPEGFLGEWEGSGSLMGNEATFEMNWNLVLGNQFIKLTFSNAIINSTFKMDAHAYFQLVEDKSIKGYWFDSRGISFPLLGTIEGEALTTEWGSPDIEQGRTVYTLIEHDFISVKDFVLKNNEYSLFAEATYQRKNN